MGHIGPILGPSWAVLGLSWLSLRKTCLGKLCVTQNLLWQILCNAKFARANFVYGLSWAIFGPSWGFLGPMLGPPWAILGPSWGYFVPSGGYFTLTLLPADLNQDFKNLCFVDAKGLFLESSHLCCVLSYCWTILGAILGHLGLS